MGTPSAALGQARPDLLDGLEEFNEEADRQGFIGLDVLPVMEVGMQSGVFGKIPVEQLLESPETARAPGAAYPRGSWKFAKDSYATEEHGWEEPVDDKEAKMYGTWFNAELISARRARDIVLRALEQRIAAAVFNTTTWTGAALTTAATTVWTDHANATPVDDVEAAILQIHSTLGLWPNALILSELRYRDLRRNQQIIDTIAGQGAGGATKFNDVTAATLAQVFGLQRILIAGSSKNTANKGQSAILSSIWDPTMAMVARLPMGGDVREPGLGRVFHWGEDGSTIGGTMEDYREERVRGNVIRCRMETDEKILFPEAGHLITGVAA